MPAVLYFSTKKFGVFLCFTRVLVACIAEKNLLCYLHVHVPSFSKCRTKRELIFTSIFKSFHQLVLSKSTFIIYVINKIKQKKQPIFQMYEDYQLGSQWSVRESLWVRSL